MFHRTTRWTNLSRYRIPMDISSKTHSRWVARTFPSMRGFTYLASAGRAPMPRRSIEEMKLAFHDAFVDVDSSVDESDYLRKFRLQASRFIGAGKDEIAFTTSTTAGINQFANSVAWRRGDKILLPSIEYPSNVIPWARVARERGASVSSLKSANGLVSVDDIERLIDDRTRVLAISLVEFSTGQRFPLRRLSEACAEHGTLLFLDAIQALGAVEVDTRKADIAGLSAGGYKWLCGPLGSGMIYISREHLHELEPRTIHWLAVRSSDRIRLWKKVVGGGSLTDTKARVTRDASAFEFSPEAIVQMAGLTASLKFLADLGMDSVEGRIRRLNDYLLSRLDLLGFRVVTPRTPDERAGIMSFYARRRISSMKEASAISRELGKVKLVVRGGTFRCAAHFFNSKADIDTALKRLTHVCRKRNILKA